MEKNPEMMVNPLKPTSKENIQFLPNPCLEKSKKFQALLAKKNSTSVYCNLFKLNVKKNSVYYQYSISFIPEIDARNTRAKLSLIRQSDEEIRSKFGDFLHTGDSLFSQKLIEDDVFEHIITDKRVEIKYSILIKKTNEIINVNEKNAQDNPASKILLEAILKEILRANPNIEFYKNLFVKKNEKATISGNTFKVDFFPGYTTSVVNTQLGLFLNVQIKNKILSTQNCLELINQKRDKTASKTENETVIKEYFIGRSIRTNYSKGNYMIHDIAFDKNPSNTTFNWKGKNISLYNYYEASHKVKIKDNKQLLFVQNKYDDENKLVPIYLVPELCLLAGIDDDMVKDRDFMKNLADFTKFKPDGIYFLR